MKVIVTPVGSFMYITNETGIAIVPERPVLVKVDEFIRTLKMQNKITHLGGESVPDEATDAEWKLWFENAGGWGQVDAAVSGFIGKWEGLDEESLAEQARITNERVAQEANERAAAENLAAQQKLLADEEARVKAEAAAKAEEARVKAERLAEENTAKQKLIDDAAKKETEKKVK